LLTEAEGLRTSLRTATIQTLIGLLAVTGLFSAGPPCGGGRFLAFAQLRG
jgi:hypothetical protein